MSDIGGPSGIEPGPASRPPSRWRLAIEFVLLFGVAMLLKQFVLTGSNGPYPNPLWLPVIVLSLQHGLAAGVAATIIAAGLQFSGGLPPALLTEDMYSYIGRLAAEPVSWACVALLVGHIRSQQIAHVAQLQADLAERGEQCAAVADLCVDLRGRIELLERHIAANAYASNMDIAEAIRDLNDSTWDDFPERLTRFVVLMTGAADFSVYLLRDNALKVVFQPNDEHTAAGDVTVRSDDALFAAIVNERQTLSARRPADLKLLGNRGIMIGPLLDANAATGVTGMLAIGGGAIEDHPEDIERRFSLTLKEISRLLGRIILIENWHAAAAPGQSNGHLHSDDRDEDAAHARKGGAPPGETNGQARPDQKITLQ